MFSVYITYMKNVVSADITAFCLTSPSVRIGHSYYILAAKGVQATNEVLFFQFYH